MKELLTDKKILITGGSSGIGRATAVFCVEQGAHVVVVGRDRDRLLETQSLCHAPERCHPLECEDLGETDQIRAIFERSLEAVGPLDGVVHSAGIAKLLPLKIISEDDYNEHFNIHVKAAVFISKEFQRKKNHDSNGASLIFVSSVSAFSAAIAQSLYAAAKSAQIGLTKSLAIEMVSKNIRVNAIAPADVNTSMSENCLALLSPEQHEQHVSNHPMGLGCADDVAYGIAFLLSDYARWITGTTMFVDGGFSAT